jgi:hypothetical protein
VAAIRKSRAEIEALMKDYESAAPLQEAGGRAVERLSAREKEVYQVDYETVEDGDNLPGKLISQVRHLLDVVDYAGPPVAAGALERLADLEAEWDALRAELDAITSTDIAAVNRWARDNTIRYRKQTKARAPSGSMKVPSMCKGFSENRAAPLGGAGNRPDSTARWTPGQMTAFADRKSHSSAGGPRRNIKDD